MAFMQRVLEGVTNNADVILTGNLINTTNKNGNATISGENIQFKTATNSKDVTIGGSVRSSSAVTILETGLTALIRNISLLTIGQTDSNNTITLNDSLRGSVGNRPMINIIGGNRNSIVGLENTKSIFRVTGIP